MFWKVILSMLMCYKFPRLLSPKLLSSPSNCPEISTLSNSATICSSKWALRKLRAHSVVQSVPQLVWATFMYVQVQSSLVRNKFLPRSDCTCMGGGDPLQSTPQASSDQCCLSSSPPPSLRSTNKLVSTPFGRRMGKGFLPRPILYTAASCLENGKQVAS